MKNIDPTTTDSWKKLEDHYKVAKDYHLKNLFQDSPERADEFSIKWEDFYVDFSKNLISKETMGLLNSLAEEVGLEEAIDDYFSGDPINRTEHRRVLHTALRESPDATIEVDGSDIIPEISEVKKQMKEFSDSVIDGSRKGYTGLPITDVVNIGIGGSDLGPVMITEALAYYKNHLNVHFVSNIDGDHVHETIKKLRPESTLFIVVSKSFSTQETLTNASTLRSWFLKTAPETAVSKHFIAVSSNVPAVEKFGIHPDNIFPMWDWVGGRFSLWSSVGISISLAVGYTNFESMLNGAHAMDVHFKRTPLEENIPVQLALLSVWYNNFFQAESEAIIPYSQYLHRLPAYLQQAVMESNGKGVDRNGEKVKYQTGTIIWGEPGTNSQHAFFQLIHQGTKLIPADFIGFKNSLNGDIDHHNKLMANFFAQTEALLQGKTPEEVRNELALKNFSKQEMAELLPFKVFQGNKPTTSFLIEKLTPDSLGKLVAMYEHKIFVQGVIWNIFSYDQWGVELGKQLASTILDEIDKKKIFQHDSSTAKMLNYYLSVQKTN